MNQSQAELLAKSDFRLVRLFSVSCVSAFKVLWKTACSNSSNVILQSTEELLWQSIEKTEITKLRKILETIRHLPELENHYGDTPRERFAYSSAFVFCPAIALFLTPGDSRGLLHISNTCISISRELDALEGTKFEMGRKTRALVEHDSVGDIESQEVERQEHVLNLIQENTGRFSSLLKRVRVTNGLDAVITAKGVIERFLA